MQYERLVSKVEEQNFGEGDYIPTRYYFILNFPTHDKLHFNGQF